jgi:hypothetical protein
MSLDDITSSKGQEMASFVPSFYQPSRIMQWLFQVEGAQYDLLFDALNQILQQFFAETATWGLNFWESDLGLLPAPNLPDDQRKSRIMAKSRGVGTATRAVVTRVANAYQNGTVDLSEDPAGYTIYVIFIDERGIPPNLSDLQAILRAIVPAHLDIQYVFRYTVYSDIDGHYTYDQLDNSGLTYDQLMTQLPPV